MKETRLRKRCEGYKTREGKPNPECLKWFLVKPEHYERSIYCISCQRLKYNTYQRRLMRKVRARRRAEKESKV